MSEKFSYSLDGEYYCGSYDSIADAAKAGGEAYREVGRPLPGKFSVGENVAPMQPEEWWDANHWLEHVSCQDDYMGEHADAWDCSTRPQRKELEREVRAVMAAWLDRHGLRPAFWNITNITEFSIDVDGTVMQLGCDE